MKFNYTAGQAAANKLVDDFLEDPKALFMMIFGSAGTGKTTITELIPGKIQHGRVVGTAPTHKAVGVLAERLQGAECMTIHRFLGLRPKRSKDKMVLTRRDDYDPSANMDVRVVTLDEGSMVNTELRHYIIKDAEEWGRKYIIVGDMYQLNPPNEMETPMFNTNYGRYSIELTEIVRQAEENPIIRAATFIRDAIRTGKEPQVVAGTVGDLGVHMMRREPFMAKLAELCHDHDPDSFRVIAYRNDRVREYNQAVREILGYDTSLPFSEGEWVVVNEAYIVDEQVLLNTGVEYEVKSMVPITHPVHDDLTGWYVTLVDEDGTLVADVPVLDHEKSGEAYKQRLAKLRDSGASFNDWRPFYALSEFWCDLRPLYSITAHKSQGSTFDNGFVDFRDIYSNRVPAEADRCLYVAITRFRYNVYILV